MVRVSVVGAGSANFSVSFVRDLCVSSGLGGSQVVFMDVDRERLNIVYKLAARYRAETGADLEFKRTTVRKEALDGCDFVISAVKVGGYEPMEAERKIAERHGFYRGIGDRVSDYYGGVGAYYQLKFFLDLARDMEKLCPDAWLVETANPVFEGTTLIARETGIKVVGVCHGHFSYKQLIDAVGLDAANVKVEMAGFNHCIWLTKFLHKGRDCYPLLDRWIKRKAEKYWASDQYLKGLPWEAEQLSPAAVDMYRLYGVFPIGDTIRSASPWWYHTDLEAKKRWFGPTGGFDSEVGWAIYLKLLQDSVQRMKALSRNPSAVLTEVFPYVLSGEQHIPFIDAVVNDKKTLLYLNILNDGAVANLPRDVVVEIPTVVGRGGVRGVRVGKLPQRLMLHVILPRMLLMERILHAFLKGDRRSLLLTLLDDPRAESFEQCEALLNELLVQPWNAEASTHYKK